MPARRNNAPARLAANHGGDRLRRQRAFGSEPAKYFVVVTKREKRACKHCEEGGVAAAPVPARIIEKGLVSNGMVVNTIVAKYCDHLPLYRQSAILEREAGVDISRATMDGWVMRGGRVTHSHRGSDAPGLTRRQLHSGR